MWIKIWEELHSLAARDITVEVEHVKAHCTKKEKKEMSHSEKFVTEGNEKADDLAKAVAMLDEGFMAQARAETMQQDREEVYAALQYGQLSLFDAGMERLWGTQAKAKKKRTPADREKEERSGALKLTSIDA